METEKKFYKIKTIKLNYRLLCPALIFVVALFFMVIPVRVAAAEKTTADKNQKQVLFISSYSESFDTVDLQKTGISKIFDKNDIQMDIEYMDMKNHNTSNNEDNFYNSLKYKIENHTKYDAILLGDDAAMHFGVEHQKDLFDGIPMVFFCVNDVNEAEKAAAEENITGSVEEFYLKDTIDIALKFQPGVKKIYAVYDNTLTGKGDQEQFFKLKDQYKDLSFIGLNSSQYDLVEFGKKLECISGDSIVIYMDMFEDISGNQFTILEALKFIDKHISVPIYRTSIGGVGEGIIGGKMVSYEKSGETAANMIVKIFNGEKTDDIALIKKGESQYYFDYKLLKKYNINMSAVPKDSVIVNKNKSFFEKYRDILIPMTAVIIVSIIILAIVAYDDLRKRDFLNQLKNSHYELRNTYEKLKLTENALENQYRENKAYTMRLEKTKEDMEYQAQHDHMTGLPNRRDAVEKLEGYISNGEDVSVILLDLDNFKEINDTYGHLCGDYVLKEAAARFEKLQQNENVYIARVGGDEFLFISKEKISESNNKLVEKIFKILNKTFNFEEKKLNVKASIGVASTDMQDVEEINSVGKIMGHADLAMFSVKKSGKGGCDYYDKNMESELLEKNRIKDILEQACKEDGFDVVYQPQIDINTGEPHCYEALVRLKNHNISPACFIPIAEESDIIIQIGRIVTKKVIRQLVKWKNDGVRLHPVSINYSNKQIRDKDYVTYLKELLDKYNISSEYIEIEFTESIMLDDSQSARTLFEAFKNIGISMALDDFGTGYSSINYLTYIPVSKIKLDKSMADTYLCEGREEFVNNIIRLSHCQGLRITVEGIEEESQVEILKKFSCDYIQGYYYSKPISGEEIEIKYSK